VVNVALGRLQIREALAQVPAADRAILRRSYNQGLTTPQIAEDLQIGEDAVKSRLHHTLHTLRRTLQEQEMEAPHRRVR
jgi:RNA polymerase sigma factor (sigma-70 family)